MAYVKRVRVLATVTATGGASWSITSPTLYGQVEAIRYTRGLVTATTSGISTAARLTITGAQSGIPVLDTPVSSTAPMTFYPRGSAQGLTGAALTFASGATAKPVPVLVPIAGEGLRLQFTSGGAASGGGLRAYLDIYLSGA